MMCRYCGKEILGQPYVVGPKRLGMTWCSSECLGKATRCKNEVTLAHPSWQI